MIDLTAELVQLCTQAGAGGRYEMFADAEYRDAGDRPAGLGDEDVAAIYPRFPIGGTSKILEAAAAEGLLCTRPFT